MSWIIKLNNDYLQDNWSLHPMQGAAVRFKRRSWAKKALPSAPQGCRIVRLVNKKAFNKALAQVIQAIEDEIEWCVMLNDLDMAQGAQNAQNRVKKLLK